MLAYLILVFAAVSRFLPHMFHGTALNITAVGAGLLLFGSRRPAREAILAAVVLAFSDFLLTRYVYRFPFHASEYAVTWAWYLGVALLASQLLRRVTALRVVAGVLSSAASFFLLSNFMVWLSSGMYGHSISGLGACYVAALPFLRNDLISTGVFSAAFFGLPVLARKLAQVTEPAGHTA